MAIDLSPSTGRDGVRVPVRRHRRRAIVLGALALFQFWLWGTRIFNLVQDVGDFSTAFVTIHLGLYTAAIGAGVVLALLGARMWIEASRAARVDQGGRTARDGLGGTGGTAGSDRPHSSGDDEVPRG